jgi:hypothetical protein
MRDGSRVIAAASVGDRCEHEGEDRDQRCDQAPPRERNDWCYGECDSGDHAAAGKLAVGDRKSGDGQSARHAEASDPTAGINDDGPECDEVAAEDEQQHVEPSVDDGVTN